MSFRSKGCFGKLYSIHNPSSSTNSVSSNLRSSARFLVFLEHLVHSSFPVSFCSGRTRADPHCPQSDSVLMIPHNFVSNLPEYLTPQVLQRSCVKVWEHIFVNKRIAFLSDEFIVGGVRYETVCGLGKTIRSRCWDLDGWTFINDS